MPDRAALVTGASSGIGLSIARVLGEEGYGLTVAARRPEKLSLAVEELRAKGYELVVNLASIAGKGGAAWLSVYAATKAAVVGWTQSMNKELNGEGIKNVALAPGFVDTPMSDFIKEQVSAEEMITPEDIGEAVRYLMKTSPACVIPEIVFQRPGEAL